MSNPHKLRDTPLWKGPRIDGVTQSMISKFLTCRERFRLNVIEGIKAVPKFNHRLEYGTMWHLCEEYLAQDNANSDGWRKVLKDHTNNLLTTYKLEQKEVLKWSKVCEIQFEVYKDHWKDNDDVKARIPLYQEKVFDVMLDLPSGEKVRMRGRWDAVDIINDKIYIQENKSKSVINERELLEQLKYDLQSMTYLYCLKKHLDIENPELSTPIQGIRYNVIKRPLSGGKGTIVQHKPTKKNPRGESSADYYKRLQGIIKEFPKEFFQRWEVNFDWSEVEIFFEQTLAPILDQMCVWYDHVEDCKLNRISPFRPCLWSSNDMVHWKHPFGARNMIDEDYGTDLDNFLTTGSMVGLTKVDKLFTELL